MKFGDKGADVQELQEALIAHDYRLHKYGADGHLGQETMAALKGFTGARSIAWSSAEVPQEALEALGWDAPEDPEIPKAPQRTLEDVQVYDLRSAPLSERLLKKFRLRPGTPRMPVIRDPSQVTGITIHQTAARYGVAQYQVAIADGDARLALAKRSLRVACHMMAFHDGFLAWPNPLDWYVYHGNGWNTCELGLEIDGNYPGVKDGKTWNGKKPTRVTPEVIRAARAAVELLVIEGRKLGMPIEYIHAHRQSSSTRRDDPGEELWKAVVLGFAVPMLGLKVEQGRTLGGGRPVPIEWDPNGVGRY